MIVAALVTAAGHGTRMQTHIPKQYLDLEGLMLIVRTLQVFQRHPLTGPIVLTVPVGDEDFCRKEILAPNGLSEIAIVEGGPSRQASVYNGLRSLVSTDLVVIHDGVRPMVGSQVITKTIETAATMGAALACARVRETVKKQHGLFLETIPRSDLWLAHTPQTFRTTLILEAHEKALDEGFEATDDASLVERLGQPIGIVEDSDENIKITTPRDLDVASLLLRRSMA